MSNKKYVFLYKNWIHYVIIFKYNHRIAKLTVPVKIIRTNSSIKYYVLVQCKFSKTLVVAIAPLQPFDPSEYRITVDGPAQSMWERERKRNAHSSKATRNRHSTQCLSCVRSGKSNRRDKNRWKVQANLMFVYDYWFEFNLQATLMAGRVKFMAGKEDLTRTRIDSTRNYTIYYKPTNPTIHPLQTLGLRPQIELIWQVDEFFAHSYRK